MSYRVVHVDIDVTTASGRRWNVQELVVHEGRPLVAGAFPERKDGSLGHWRALRVDRLKSGATACQSAAGLAS